MRLNRHKKAQLNYLESLFSLLFALQQKDKLLTLYAYSQLKFYVNNSNPLDPAETQVLLTLLESCKTLKLTRHHKRVRTFIKENKPAPDILLENKLNIIILDFNSCHDALTTTIKNAACEGIDKNYLNRAISLLSMQFLITSQKKMPSSRKVKNLAEQLKEFDLKENNIALQKIPSKSIDSSTDDFHKSMSILSIADPFKSALQKKMPLLNCSAISTDGSSASSSSSSPSTSSSPHSTQSEPCTSTRTERATTPETKCLSAKASSSRSPSKLQWQFPSYRAKHKALRLFVHAKAADETPEGVSFCNNSHSDHMVQNKSRLYTTPKKSPLRFQVEEEEKNNTDDNTYRLKRTRSNLPDIHRTTRYSSPFDK